MVRLSFRDVFKYCYLKQDDVGSKGLLGGVTMPSKRKVRRRLNISSIFGDMNISDVEGELAALMNKGNVLRSKYETISDFLRETEFESETNIADTDSVLGVQEEALRQQLRNVNAVMIADNENYLFLKETLLELTGAISLAGTDRAASELAVDRFVRLKNDYQNDIQKLKSIRVAKSVIGASAESFSCPLCDSIVPLAEVKDEFSIDEGDRAAQEVNTLTRRIRDLDVLIQAERDKQHGLSIQLSSLTGDRDKARRLLDEEAANMITPYLSERDGLSSGAR